jgi:hypothetical protein
MSEDLDQNQKFKIKNRESLVKSIILLAFVFVVLLKFLESPFNFNIDLSKLGFTDVLSLLLALFSIGISVAFYFKATDSSNDFYDNTYKFTQEMSKMLARIDSGFGEKLNNIHEAQGQMGDKINQLTAPHGTNENSEVAEIPQETIKATKNTATAEAQE